MPSAVLPTIPRAFYFLEIGQPGEVVLRSGEVQGLGAQSMG